MTPANPDALADALAEFQRQRGFHKHEIEELLMDFGALVLAAAEARAAQLQAEVEAVLDEATRMSSILLMAGEMTAQERRTARAVALGISLRVHTALAARAATAREGQTHTPASGALKIEEADRDA